MLQRRHAEPGSDSAAPAIRTDVEHSGHTRVHRSKELCAQVRYSEITLSLLSLPYHGDRF